MHHAGYYTLQYLKSNAATEEFKQRAFKEAVRIDTEDFGEISDFLFNMAAKITRETVKAITAFPEFKELSPENERYQAVQQMLQAPHDILDDLP